jgi:hypothetical protein
MEFSTQVSEVLIEIKDLLIRKNLKYGNSAIALKASILPL